MVQANTTDLYAVLKIMQVSRCLFGVQFPSHWDIPQRKTLLIYADKWRGGKSSSIFTNSGNYDTVSGIFSGSISFFYMYRVNDCLCQNNLPLQ